MGKQPEMRNGLNSQHILTLVVIALFLFLLLGSCTPSMAPYGVSNARMTYCDESENVCTLNSITKFEIGDKICIAWTDVNRSPSDKLSIFIYKNGEWVYDKKVEDEIKSRQECRAIPVETPLSSGLYETEFALNGRLVEQIVWEIKQPPPPTPAAPPYSIENPRMVICNSDVNVCRLEGVSQFSLTDEICTAWTEVDRSPNDSFAFFVYNEKDERMLSHIESTIDSRITRNCRVEQIDNPNVSGTYRTEFTAKGRPVDKISWSIYRDPIACNIPPVTGNLFPQLADVDGQFPMHGPIEGTDAQYILCEAVSDIIHEQEMSVHFKYEQVGTNYGWWGIATPNGYDASVHRQLCFWAYAKQPYQSFRVKMKDTSLKEAGPAVTIGTVNNWEQICTDIAEFEALGIMTDKMDNVNLGFEAPLGSAEIWVAEFEFR